MSAAKTFRSAPRKQINEDIAKLTIDSISSCENLQKFAKFGQILQASSTGILIKFKREDFVSKELRSNLNIDSLVGQEVYFKIHEMDLEISGRIARTKFLGKDGYHVAIDYSSDTPEYWRECVMDLLPTG